MFFPYKTKIGTNKRTLYKVLPRYDVIIIELNYNAFTII